MYSHNIIAFIGLSFLAASGVALPSPFNKGGPGPEHGPFKGPGGKGPGGKGPGRPSGGPPAGPHTGTGTVGEPFFPGPTDIGEGPLFPTGGFPSGGSPTGFPGAGTATNGLPIVPIPTVAVDEDLLERRFEGPRGHGPGKPWHVYNPSPNKPSRPDGPPRPPPFVTGGPIASGTQGPPLGIPSGGPGGPPPAGPTQY